VVPGGVLVASIVGCDDGYAVRVRHPRTATVRGAPIFAVAWRNGGSA
jgi:hypothetical protein